MTALERYDNARAECERLIARAKKLQEAKALSEQVIVRCETEAAAGAEDYADFQRVEDGESLIELETEFEDTLRRARAISDGLADLEREMHVEGRAECEARMRELAEKGVTAFASVKQALAHFDRVRANLMNVANEWKAARRDWQQHGDALGLYDLGVAPTKPAPDHCAFSVDLHLLAHHHISITHGVGPIDEARYLRDTHL